MLILKRIFKTTNLYLLSGSLLVLFSVTLAVTAPVLAKSSPTQISPHERLLPPSKNHPLGTDKLGRDVLSRVLFGMRNSLEIALFVVILTTAMGLAVGLVAGYFPKVDIYLSRVLDAMMAFPAIIIAISLAGIWGAGKFNIVFSMSFAYFRRMARAVRASTISVKEMDFVESAKAAGAGRGGVTLSKEVTNPTRHWRSSRPGHAPLRRQSRSSGNSFLRSPSRRSGPWRSQT